MKRALLTAVVVASLLGAVVAPAAAATAAQQNSTQQENSTQPPSPREQAGGGQQQAGGQQQGQQQQQETKTVVAQVDEDVRVLDYYYDEDRQQFGVTLENIGDRSSSVTVTEVVSPDSDGSGSFGIQQQRIRPGETLTVEVSAERNRGAAGVMITTQKSIDAGKGTYLADTESLSIFSGAASWADVRAGVFATLVFSLVVVLLASWHHVAVKNRDVKEVNV